jgi:trk system potassium uptake protein TrkH
MKPITHQWTVAIRKQSPARLLLFSFMVMIAFGTLLLMLPASSHKGALPFVDALFTATSAGCVTGLSVWDVAETLTPFGLGVLLALIQLGGLGIMTISTLLILGAQGRVGFAGNLIIQDCFTHSGKKDPVSILRSVIQVTVAFELLGALLLFCRFYPGAPSLGNALWLSVFHSISAFCNAGFALYPDSLSRFRGDLLVNGVLSFLIIAGGLGFLVISELQGKLRPGRFRWERLSLHTRLVVTTSFFLLLSGGLFTLVLEWDNTLGGLPLHEKLLAAFFQSVTLRTAGFNTIDFGTMANGTLFLSLIFMFIGGSPGSCAGGVKTTTVATLFIMGWSRLKGAAHVSAFSRTIPNKSVEKATHLVMLAFVVVTFGTLVLLSSEMGDLAHSESRGRFIELLFESVSAFGTVGLSMGVTPTLSTVGRLCVIFLMFVGRLGPMVVAVAISRGKAPRFRWAEEDIMIG